MQGKNNMSDELMEIFQSDSKGNIYEKKTQFWKKQPLPACTDGKQTSL